MKTHAPSGKKRNARLATATIALFAALAPASAWALDMPVPAGDQSCPATGIETVAPLQVAVQTKSEAILGGTRSKLEELKAQQAAAAAAAITPAPAPMVQLAMLSPAAGPAPVAAPCTAMAFARLPQMAQETTLAPRARYAMGCAPCRGFDCASSATGFGLAATAGRHQQAQCVWQRGVGHWSHPARQ